MQTNSSKCPKCGLKNFATDVECRRCGMSFVRKAASPGSRPKVSIVSLVTFAGVVGVFYYIFVGVQGSVDKVNSTEANRVRTQPALPREAGRSRSEYERYRTQTVANAVGAAPGLAEHANRTQQTEKAINQIVNSQPQ